MKDIKWLALDVKNFWTFFLFPVSSTLPFGERRELNLMDFLFLQNTNDRNSTKGICFPISIQTRNGESPFLFKLKLQILSRSAACYYAGWPFRHEDKVFCWVEQRRGREVKLTLECFYFGVIFHYHANKPPGCCPQMMPFEILRVIVKFSKSFCESFRKLPAEIAMKSHF